MLRACALVALIGGGLLGTCVASAAGPAAERAAPPDAPTAAEVAFHLRYDAPSPGAPPRDRWIAQDKATHVVVSGLWTLSAQYVLVNKAGWAEGDALPVSVASAAVVGGAKELYDATRPAGTASGKDLVADAVGIGLAVGVIVL
jgi:uncharacterized protein YfiM (DUF2279 family)